MNNKVNLIFPFIRLIFTRFKLLLKNLMHFTIEQNSLKIADDLGYRNGLPKVNILDIIPELNISIKNITFLDGTSRIPDIALLIGLSQKFKDCDYLEIGSWRGESILNVSYYAKHCVSLGLSEQEMRELNFSDGIIKSDGLFIKNIPNITTIRHNSQTFDFKTLDKKFDLIFIDGDHSYEAVLNDTRNAFQMLKNDNSIIVWHDCGNTYEDFRWEVVTAVLEGTPLQKRKKLFRVSNTLCAIYYNANVNSYYSTFPEQPNKLFDIKLTAKSI